MISPRHIWTAFILAAMSMAAPCHAEDWIIAAEAEDMATWVSIAAFLDLETVIPDDDGRRGQFSFVRMQEETAGDVVLTDERLELLADCEGKRLKYLSSAHYAEDGTRITPDPGDEGRALPADWIDIHPEWLFGNELAESLCMSSEQIDPDRRMFRDMTPIAYLRAYLDGYKYGH